jgi:small subunit ribosomal protein S17
MAETVNQETPRAQRRTVVGIVTGAKMNKTRRVDVARLTKHEKYGKYIRRKTVCYVHDEENKSVEGDRVEIMECRPISKLKRWRLVSIISHDAAIPKGDLIQATLETPAAE